MKVKEIVKENAVRDLEKDLKDPYSYNAIDHMMQTIAKKHNISPDKLHDLFVKKHKMIPDKWVQQRKRKKVKEQELMYKGYPCTKDCSGHAAGYEWGTYWNVQDPNTCPYGKSNSFWEGCKSRGEGK